MRGEQLSELVNKYYDKLDNTDKKIFKMYQDTLKDIDKQLTDQWRKMKADADLNDWYRIGRLDNLEAQIKNEIAKLMQNVADEVEKTAIDTTIKFNNEFGERMLKDFPNSKDFSGLNKGVIEQLVNENWLGVDYRERLGFKETSLSYDCINVLKVGLVQGKSMANIINDMQIKTGKYYKECTLMVRTETMHTLNASLVKQYEELGVGEVEHYTALDERVCKECGSLHEKKYKIGKEPPLPVHINCRCVYIETEESLKKALEKLDKKEMPSEKDKTPLNKNNKEIKFELDGMSEKGIKNIKETILELSEKYNTSLNVVRRGKGNEAGHVDVAYNMYLSSTKREDITHEFAHTLAIKDSDKLKLTDNKEFWKEITKIRKQYEKACANNTTKAISSYSHDSIDEFMAEAFTHSYLKDENILNEWYGKDYEYSDKVMAIINKYFKK